MLDWAGFQDPNFYSQGVSDFWLFSSFSLPLTIAFGLLILGIGAVVLKLKKSQNYKKLFLHTTLVTSLFFTLFWPVINYLGPTTMYWETVSYANKHQSGLTKLFTSDINTIANCTQKLETCRNKANQLVLDAISRDNTLSDFPSTYFVRFTNSGDFEKLFIDGTYKKTLITTEKEKIITQFITSGSPFLVSAFIDNAIDATYLNDLYSEAEIFVPVKQNGKTIGIVVRLYGS